jgi:hypothetical protein
MAHTLQTMIADARRDLGSGSPDAGLKEYLAGLESALERIG